MPVLRSAYSNDMKRRNFLKFAFAALPFFAILALILAVIFYPAREQPSQSTERVVRVWNVDTFEGGKGSRTAFLRATARRTESAREGVYYLVTSYTEEGAVAAFERGEAPDMLSFGIGLSVYAEMSIPLDVSFAGGTLDGVPIAYPWCRGEYALFSMTEDFEEAGDVALSVGGNNLTEVAAVCAGIEGARVESMAAYVGFLDGKYRYLLGTQRDVCRFSARGVRVAARPLSAYNDLYQYISILSSGKYEDCAALLRELLSEKTQDSLSSIGMLPVGTDRSERTVSVFSDTSALERLRASAGTPSERKNLYKFLKTI